MEKEISDLYIRKETKELTIDAVNRDILDLREAVVTCSKYNELEHIIDEIDEILENRINRLTALKKEKEEIEHDIEKYQESCSHVFEYIGYDSHYDYYECKKCGKKERS